MIAILAMPEDPVAVPEWLDQQLLAADLPRFVDELRVLHQPGPKPSLANVLGKHRAAFLQGGFTAIPRSVLKQLLGNPDLLIEAQELVYFEGGTFWFDGPLSSEEAESAAQVADKVYELCQVPATPRQRTRRWWEYAGVSLATAAAVLVAVYLIRPIGNDSANTARLSGWGFAKIQQLDRQATPQETYTTLAELANEWHKKPTPDAQALALRLSEFRQGCTALQLATDLPLNETERQWLKRRCSDWAAEFDNHLRKLEETRDTAAVQLAAAETVKQIVAELKQRSGIS